MAAFYDSLDVFMASMAMMWPVIVVVTGRPMFACFMLMAMIMAFLMLTAVMVVVSMRKRQSRRGLCVSSQLDQRF